MLSGRPRDSNISGPELPSMTAEDDQTDDDDGGPLTSVKQRIDEVVWFIIDLIIDLG